jgi:phage baseplate assembly protein V
MKELLSDTDYTSGRDNRYFVTAVVGRVSKVEVSEKGANVRVIMPDRLDHQDQPLITKPIPVLQVASTAKKSFAVPRQDDNVFLIKLANGTSNYAVLGSFYTSKRPPPVTDAMLDYCEYDDGSTMQFNASTGELTWKLKGDMLWDNEKDFTLKTKGDVIIEIDGDVTIKPGGNVSIDAGGDVDVKAGGDLTLQGTTVKVIGNPITLDGLVHTTANMTTDGFHTDNKGPHSATEREAELEARVARLEERLAILEGAQHGD